MKSAEYLTQFSYTVVDPNQTDVSIPIFACDKPVVFLTNDPGVSLVGYLTLNNLPDKGKPRQERKIEIKMKGFGASLITVEAVYLPTGDTMHANIEWEKDGMNPHNFV